MRAVCQRVLSSTLTVENEVISKISQGLLVYIGFSVEDTKESVVKSLNKISGLRIFEDSNNKLNLSLKDISGEIMIVSNFTLYGDCTHGFRPSFTRSAKFDDAKELYDFSLKYLADNGYVVKKCVFGGDMIIDSVADGPVNIIIDSEDL